MNQQNEILGIVVLKDDERGVKSRFEAKIIFNSHPESNDCVKLLVLGDTHRIANMIHHKSKTIIVLDVRFKTRNTESFNNVVKFVYTGYQNVNWEQLQKQLTLCE